MAIEKTLYLFIRELIVTATENQTFLYIFVQANDNEFYLKFLSLVLPDQVDEKRASTVSRHSNIWVESSRDECSANILTIQQINAMRSECLISGQLCILII